MSDGETMRNGVMSGEVQSTVAEEQKPPPSQMPDAARRALAEAEARRAATLDETRPREINGRSGPEPVRYGDWENKGIASDF